MEQALFKNLRTTFPTTTLESVNALNRSGFELETDRGEIFASISDVLARERERMRNTARGHTAHGQALQFTGRCALHVLLWTYDVAATKARECFFW
jgi:hypothetical protein